jgi:hypothetical protein
MIKKYELTDETTQVNGKTLHRIRAVRDFSNVKKGDLGGFIKSESNLSHDGDCWVYDSAHVCGSAWVNGSAHVYGLAHISGSAHVYGSARVYGFARVCGLSEIIHNAKITSGTYENRLMYE